MSGQEDYARIHIIKGVVAFMVVAVVLLASGCTKEKKHFAKAISTKDSLPTMATYKIVSLISDSGLVRYRIKTNEWLVYAEKNPSYWAFRKGIYVEQFDSLHHVYASIKADTAYFYDKRRLWKLAGHVDIKNRKGERFTTSLLFWDQAMSKVYSDRAIKIRQADRIISARGFESNQEMTVYKLHNMSGIFYVNDKKQAVTPADTVKKKK